MKKNLVIFFSIFLLQNCFGAVIDNRYFPWINPPAIRTLERYSGITSNLFFVFADEAYASSLKDKIGIPEIWGVYDQKQMSNALLFIGETTPLLPQWQLQRSIDWYVKQKIQGQGLQIKGEHYIYNGFSFGYNTGYMHLSSDQAFILPKSTIREMALTIPQQEELDRERREMFNQLGLTSSQSSASGFIDTVIYFKYGKAWEYQAKCRTVALSISAGMLIPSGKKRECFNTGSLPFGGDGATGFFVSTDDSFELKEDLTAGFSLELCNRLKKNIQERIPVDGQSNYLFGALEGPIDLDAGFTVRVSPYILLGNLRDGFDLSLQYTYTNHSGDMWKDARQNQTIPSNLNGLYKKSEWESDYVSLTVLYDSGKVLQRNSFEPSVIFTWDIPVRLLTAHEVSRTNSISLGIELSF